MFCMQNADNITLSSACKLKCSLRTRSASGKSSRCLAVRCASATLAARHVESTQTCTSKRCRLRCYRSGRQGCNASPAATRLPNLRQHVEQAGILHCFPLKLLTHALRYLSSLHHAQGTKQHASVTTQAPVKQVLLDIADPASARCRVSSHCS